MAIVLIGKSDKVNADGLAVLHHNCCLPADRIPTPDLRCERELPRAQLACHRVHTVLKNRIRATPVNCALSLDTRSSVFAPKSRPQFLALMDRLPTEAGRSLRCAPELLELV